MKTYYLEISIISVFIMLFLAYKLNSISKTLSHTRLRTMYIFVAAFSAIDGFTAFIDGSDLPIPLSYIANIAYFSLSMMVPYIWYRYVLGTFKIHHRILAKTMMLLPMIIVFVIVALTPVTDWFFTIDDANIYHRSGLYFFQPLVSLFYLVAGTVICIRTATKSTDYAEKHHAKSLSSFIIFPLLAAVGEIILPDTPLIAPVTAILMLLYFILLQEQMISTDVLTGVHNRREFEKHVREIENISAYLIIIDIDNFKSINDAFGHVDGDNAIVRVSDVLDEVCSKQNAFLARYGGDEFIITINTDDYTRVSGFVSTIKQSILASNIGQSIKLSVSCGTAPCNLREKSLSQIIATADEELYRDKAFKASLL